MAKQTFELVSPFLSIYAPSRTWGGDSSLLLGQTTNHLLPGEFLSYKADYSVERGDNSAEPSFAFFSEPGRGDLVTSGKIPVLQFGPYEADTSIYLRVDNTGLPAAGLTVGAPVSVTNVQHPDVPISADKPCRGIKAAADGEFVVGYISRITGTGVNQKIRILVGIGSNHKA
ncbi:MAG: hypothetical protein VXZ72_00010 [Chlamydiota bacterium]|nr:hypothetical protein [Chlamydiota bacterium]